MSTQAANFRYSTDTEAPPMPLTWLDADGSIVDFSTGWTFEIQLLTYAATPTVQKNLTTGISGGATSPNILVDWPVGYFADVPPARYRIRLLATETASGKTREFAEDNPPTVEVGQAPV